MFAKGARFDKQKISDVPGPNYYDTDKPSSLTNYKRGAFLEKEPRFHESELEGTSSTPPQQPVDRHGMLQRKVEDLERMHCESKKAHQAEVERLRNEIARVQKLDAEHRERAEKLSKQTTILESRIQELKKSASADQAELRDLRVKLRLADNERSQQKTAQARKDATADLEKSVAAERKRREAAESEVVDIKAAFEAERASLQERMSTDKQLLEQHQMLLSRVTEQYACLAASTVSQQVHDNLRHEYGLLQMRNWRIDRRLANSQDHINLLVDLIRQKQDESAFQSRRIRDLERDLDRVCTSYGAVDLFRPAPLDDLRESLDGVIQNELRDNLAVASTQLACSSAINGAYRALGDAAILTRAVDMLDLAQERQTSSILRTELSDAREALYKEQDAAAQQTSIFASQKAELDATAHALALRAEVVAAGDKRTIQNLTETIKMARQTEDGLRAEISSLTAEVAEAEQFQAAYYGLSEEVKSLIARKELAEGEAEKLSQFNAEILGHHNPDQRILYVDRVRRELAEAKQKLALTTVELQGAKSDIAAMAREIEAYASVPLEEKPRTVVTRVARPPLSNLNRSMRPPPNPSAPASDKSLSVSMLMDDFSINI
ncbi:hypothetical protein MKEN_00654600 [Mycena kentingensis (nom. inval.)]|nr:hypothetical protein MKEN_00654600 [Mycena kentingensis (nom. inval.)]